MVYLVQHLGIQGFLMMALIISTLNWQHFGMLFDCGSQVQHGFDVKTRVLKKTTMIHCQLLRTTRLAKVIYKHFGLLHGTTYFICC